MHETTSPEAAVLFRRPFAPGAIGFRAMTKVAYNGQACAGAHVAAYIGAQSVIQRLNAVVRGRWRQQFQSIAAAFVPAGSRRVYLACRLVVTLPVEQGGGDVEAVFEDLGEMDSGSFAGLKALYSDARKRAAVTAVAAGIGAYLYTSLEAVVLPIGPHARQVQALRRQGKPDLLAVSAETEQWLRHGYQTRISTEAVRRDLGEILAHGEPENGIGHGEVADQAAQPTPEPPAAEPASQPGDERARRSRDRRLRRPRTSGRMMRIPQLTSPANATGSDAVPSAAQLAARIQIPRRLPPRYDGQPLQHLSHSSYNRFVLCPEDWRRRYALGQKTAPTGSMFLGRQVDDAITLYYRQILDHGERLSLDQLKDAFRDGWKAAAEAEREQLGICRESDLREDSAFKLGLDAVELTFTQLIPRLGEPVAVQRKVEYTLAPSLEWSVLCYLDLETRRPDAGALLPAVVDYKVKTTPLTQYKADHDFQPAVYLAGRWLEGDRAAQFCFAQIAKPGICRNRHMPGYVAQGTMSPGVRDVRRRAGIGPSGST